MTTSIKILTKIRPPLRWVPRPGDFTENFLARASSDANGPTYQDLTIGDNSVLTEAVRILGRCLPPTAALGRETGIVVGYVQSGKTLSFETVIPLARDNGYGIVIVLAGTKDNLREQSEKRLKRDLGIEDGENWYHFSNPTGNPSADQIEAKLRAWSKAQQRRKAVLITVLKQKDRLKNLTVALRKLPLDGVVSRTFAHLRLSTSACRQPRKSHNHTED